MLTVTHDNPNKIIVNNPNLDKKFPFMKCLLRFENYLISASRFSATRLIRSIISLKLDLIIGIHVDHIDACKPGATDEILCMVLVDRAVDIEHVIF